MAPVSITFRHSMPIAHVLCFLRRATMLRVAARECEADAAKYVADTAPTKRMRAWLEDCAADGRQRAAAFELVVRTIQPFPQATMPVVGFIESVMHPARSGNDLMAFAAHVERTGVEGLIAATKFGFRRPPSANFVPAYPSN